MKVRIGPLQMRMIGSALVVFASIPALAQDFEAVSIILEHNATDGDFEVVIEAEAGDAGLLEFTVTSPNKTPIAKVETGEPGAREFLIETPEPTDLDRILSAFPEGDYVFAGRGVDGNMIEATATLSHALPPAPVITLPSEDGSIPLDAGLVEWEPMPQAERYTVEIENDDLDFTLLVDLPANVNRLPIPAGVLQPNTEYQLGVMVAGGNGNLTVAETSFTTGAP